MRISIVGNIGCGKTTLLESLRDVGYDVMFEPVERWTILPLFYKDIDKWAFPLQVQILNSFYGAPTDIICERSPWEAQNIFAQNLLNERILFQEEFDLMEDIVKTIGWYPDIYIYLKTDPEKCYSRIRQRKRECENNISLNYIKQLHKLYESSKNNDNFVIIDGNQSPQFVFGDVFNKIRELIL